LGKIILILFTSLCYNANMDRIPQHKPTVDGPQDESQRGFLIWIGLALLGMLALGGLVFNLGRLFSLSRTEKPTATAPRVNSAEIEINSTVSLSDESGSFTIWGDPVNRRVICSRGEVFDQEYRDLSPDPDLMTDLEVSKHFVCEDGSGSFYLVADVDITEDTTVGTWQITGGEGDYSGLSGAGTLDGTYLTDDLVVDAYMGTVNR
jgi:hypothetical protein